MDETTQCADPGEPSGPAWARALRRLDDAVYLLETTLVVGSLLAMTLFVFVDVVYRRLSAPDSKLGGLLAALVGIAEPATRSWVDARLAPPIGAALMLWLLWFGFRSTEARRGEPWLGRRQGALVLALLAGATLWALGWLMLQPWMPSWAFYVVLASLGLVGYGAWLWRARPARAPGRFAAAALATAAFSAFARAYLPEGYSWSKEVSLVLLLWVGFLGASICAHAGKHLRMEAFERLVPQGWLRFTRALGFLVTAAFCGFMAWLGYVYVFDPIGGAKALGGVFEQTGIPDWLATLAVPVGFPIAALRFLAAAVSTLLGGSYGQPAAEEALEEAERLAAAEAGAEGAS